MFKKIFVKLTQKKEKKKLTEYLGEITQRIFYYGSMSEWIYISSKTAVNEHDEQYTEEGSAETIKFLLTTHKQNKDLIHKFTVLANEDSILGMLDKHTRKAYLMWAESMEKENDYILAEYIQPLETLRNSVFNK